MRCKAFSIILLLSFILLTTSRCFADDEKQIKAKVSQAMVKGKEVTVTLKNKTTLKGKVEAVTQDAFKLKRQDNSAIESVKLAAVASVKIHGSFGRVFATIIGGPAYARGGWKAVVGVAALFGGLVALTALGLD